MAFLFIVEDKRVTPTIEVLLMSPFKEIWERDQTPTKAEAIEDFTYIEFVASVKKSNPYSGYPESLRKQKVIADVITRPHWVPDPLIMQGIQKLLKIQMEASPTFAYLQSAVSAANKMKEFFDTFDFDTVNEKTGNPLWKPKDITSAIIDTGRILQNLTELKEKVDNDIYENTKVKGQKEVSIFADPSTL